MKLAVIGASNAQRPLFLEARKLGHETIAFAWGANAPFASLADRYYSISITEVGEIVKICRREHIDGVVSNGSNLVARISAQVSDALGLVGNPYSVLSNVANKYWVRERTQDISGLTPVPYGVFSVLTSLGYPCVIKPFVGAGKNGVSFVGKEEDVKHAVDYANGMGDLIVEKYIEGREISVESLSCHGVHQVVQITDKSSTGAPHFVELAHHQPSSLPVVAKEKIRKIVPDILSSIGFQNGASHIELKIDAFDNIYLVEVNPRGGGDEISSTLVDLSTDFGYVRAMIEVALGIYQPRPSHDVAHAGICYVCQHTKELLPIYENADLQPWFVKKGVITTLATLTESVNNRDRNAYFVYKSSNRMF